MVWEPTEKGFEEFVDEYGPQLRHAFGVRYGPDVGADVCSEALGYAWEKWPKVAGMENPAGWVFRVGQSRSRRYFRKPPQLPEPVAHSAPVVEPALPVCLSRLSNAQRLAVMLVHGYAYSIRETARLLGVAPSTVQQNATRGLARLRESLGVSTGV